MIRENLQDAGEIIQNILTQPLSIPGAKPGLTLLQAAADFDPRNPIQSDLRKIILSFLQFPEQTETLLRELDLLKEDL
jgi:hypothetical protein